MRHLLSFINPVNLARLVRYRFFVFAGMGPYLLGQAVAFNTHRAINWALFWWGFAGIFLVLVAVELFNEYFDAAEGGDRIFSGEQPDIPRWFYPAGVTALGLAFIIGLYLTLQAGWGVLLFAFFGFLGAYFYVGPPIRWAYRGFGEIVIALCYGPMMVLGSYYLQTGTVGFVPFIVSLISGLSVFCLAILNEIPDYYQDRLVGKRNLVVRLGKKKAVVLLKLCLAAVFALLIAGSVLRKIPFLSLVAVITVPWILKSVRSVEKNRENPEAFLFAVNTVVITHIVITLSLGLSLLIL